MRANGFVLVSMNEWTLIKEEVISMRERSLLNFGAICSALLTLNLLAMDLSSSYVREVNSHKVLYVVALLLGAVVILGSLYLFVKMVMHCFTAPDNGIATKIIWTIVFVSLLWVGACLYYLIVYGRASGRAARTSV